MAVRFSSAACFSSAVCSATDPRAVPAYPSRPLGSPLFFVKMFSLKTFALYIIALNVTSVLGAPACSTKYVGGVGDMNDLDRTYICTDGVLRPIPVAIDGEACPGDALPSGYGPIATMDAAMRDRFTPQQRQQMCDAFRAMNCDTMEDLDESQQNVCVLRRNDRNHRIIDINGTNADTMLRMSMSGEEPAPSGGSMPSDGSRADSSPFLAHVTATPDSGSMTESAFTTTMSETGSSSMPESTAVVIGV
ncbi:hypothetical protein BD626DRAFT_490405 [Schizophyllum amplum]|uniref:Uncharacterized protein n=1 Tax=Schizophyllum amplum TaxID=97359 RepID=A0A550CJF2_9AGAR|nr:hypothetical protein BD626DRAFT_490405 [Auriculariopsis ampla]